MLSPDAIAELAALNADGLVEPFTCATLRARNRGLRVIRDAARDAPPERVTLAELIASFSSDTRFRGGVDMIH